MDYNRKAYEADIAARLDTYRLRHSHCVAAACRALAKTYGANEEDAFVAGILHDVLKQLPKEEFLAFFAAHGVRLTPAEAAAPKLWHAMAGEIYLRETYGLPEEILRAVRYHTTGRAGMSKLERVLFVADFISEDRDYPGVEDMRRRAETSLELAMEEGLRFTIFELSEQGRPIHPDTLAAYNEILLRGNKSHGA